jgi:RHS repeat-associated protein
MRALIAGWFVLSVGVQAETVSIPWEQLRQRARQALGAPAAPPAAGETTLRGMERRLELAGLAAEARALREFREGRRWKDDERLVASPSARQFGLHSSARAAEQWIPSMAAVETSGGVDQEGGPGPGDLGESPLVRLTPEIRELAQRLDRSPAKIYAWVYNNIQMEWYAWAVQNSQCVLVSGRANDFDTATLLIALLRAAGIPARYVGAFIRLSYPELQELTGAKDRAAAVRIARNNMYIETDTDHVRVDRFLMEAWVGGRWVSLDPAFKRFAYQPGVMIPKLPFDRAAFLSAMQTRLAGDAYLEQAAQYLQANRPGTALSDLPYVGRIVPVSETGLPEALPYPVLRIYQRVSEQSNVFHHRIAVTLIAPNTGATALHYETALPAMLHQSLTVSFGAATARAQSVMEALGGLYQTPVFQTSLVPQVKLDDRVAASGSTPVQAGAQFTIRVRYYYPFRDRPEVDFSNILLAGEVAAVAIYGYQVSDRLLASRIDRLLRATPGLTSSDPAPSLGELLHIAGLRYHQRYYGDNQRLAALLQYFALIWRPGISLVGSNVEIQRLGDRPFYVTPSFLYIDARGSTGEFVDLNSDNLLTPEFKTFRHLIGANGSALEHELWEEMVLVPSMSTIKGLQIANRERIPIKVFGRSTAAAEVPRLQIPDWVKQDILRFAQDGRTITTPERAVALGRFSWAVYIAEFDDGSADHILHGYNGGGTSGPGGPAGPNPGGPGDPTTSGGTPCPDPVTISNGNMHHQFTDLRLPARGLPLVLVRTYNSQSSGAGPFGRGWTHSYHLSVRDNQTSLAFTDPSGSVLTLARQGEAFVSSALAGLRATRDGQAIVIRSKHGTEWRFHASGRLERIADRNGNSQTLDYDAAGNLRTITDPAGRVVTFTYNPQNRITALQDFAGRRWNYRYDAEDRLIESLDAAGQRTTYSYYSGTLNHHKLQTITDPEGRELTFVYYADGKVFQTIRPGGAVRHYYYMPFRRETVTVDERGFATAYQYDEQGRVTQALLPSGARLANQWSAEGLVTARTDEGGFTTRYEYDAQGNVARVTDALGGVTQFTYEPAFQRVASIRDARGNITRFEYDARGNRTRIVDAAGNETRFTYDEAGNLAAATDAEGHTARYQYDTRGFLAQFEDARGNVTRFEYDEAGRLVRRQGPLNEELTVAWDALDNATRLTDPLGNETALAYDRIQNVSQLIDANGNARRFSWDPWGNLAQVTDATGGVTRYSYNAGDCFCPATRRITQASNAKGAVWSYEYNFREQLTAGRNPLGQTQRFEYDARQNLVRLTNADGESVRLEYDALGRLTARLYPDGFRDTYTYDAAGNLLTAANPHVTYTFTYDELNRVSSARDSRFGAPIRYTYDRAGRRAAVTDPLGGVTRYTYEPDGRTASITNAAGLVTRFSYDAAGNRREAVFANGTRSTYRYDLGQRPVSLAYLDSGGAVQEQFAYTYDREGNRLTLTDAAGTHRYQYDALNRLTSASHPEGPAESYTYDAAGNRTAAAGGRAYTYDAADRLLSAGADRFSYSESGNLTARSGPGGVTRYRYDPLGRLAAVTLARPARSRTPAGAVATYKYDPFGRRIEKSAGGKIARYLYDGDDILLEYNERNAPAARFTHGPRVDEPLILERDRNGDGQFDAQERFFYQADVIGSVAALTDSSGAVVERYRYDSFGNLTILGPEAGTSVGGNPYFFTGREWDAETGLYFHRARYYDPAAGRFLQPDPLWFPLSPQSLNRYAYVRNNPVNAVDPSGYADNFTLLSRQEERLETELIAVYAALPLQPPAPRQPKSQEEKVYTSGIIDVLGLGQDRPTGVPSLSEVQDAVRDSIVRGTTPQNETTRMALGILDQELRRQRDTLLAKRESVGLTEQELTDLVDIIILRNRIGVTIPCPAVY